MQDSLNIDPEFKALIPPPSEQERQQLEENLLADGCRDPLVAWKNGKLHLIDGHNRHEICTRRGIGYRIVEKEFASRDDVKLWIINNQFGRRNLTTFARAELALKLEPIVAAKAKERQVATLKKGDSPVPPKLAERESAGETRQIIAKAASVAPETIRAAKFVAEHADEETKAKLRSDPNLKLHRVAKDLRETKQREERQAKRVEAAAAVPAQDERIIVGDFRKHADKVADGSVSLIFTDPPYDREATKMLPELAAFAAAKLCEGGSLLCYVGQTQLPDALDAFRKSLRYWWTIACVHSGRATEMKEYGIKAGWKPVLWFVKKTRDDNSVFVSDKMSGGEEKTHHDWQQSQSEAAYWIEKLCPADGLVCDPFLGGGTCAAAAESLKRRWIGFEIDPDNAKVASSRLSR